MDVETEPQRDLVTYTGSLSEEVVEPQFAPRQLGAKSFAFLQVLGWPESTSNSRHCLQNILVSVSCLLGCFMFVF